MHRLLTPSLDWLLPLIPVSIALHYLAPDRPGWIFLTACLAIVPLAGWLGEATEHLADRTSEGVGGLLNATFGNAAELIIALAGLHSGVYEVVKASLTGSIIGNTLLVLGAATLAGGVRHKVLSFNPVAARTRATALVLAAIAFIVPAAFHLLVGEGHPERENRLSLVIALVMLITYCLGLFFSLHTHKQFFAGSRPGGNTAQEPEHQPWPLTRSIGVLAIATALIAWVSEVLVGSVEQAASSFGMSSIFVGVVIVAIVGNAAEHSTAVAMALKNRMDLSLGISLGSSLQIALFVAPVILLASYVLGPAPMNLVFTPAEVLAVWLAVSISSQIAGDGESNWIEGVQLIAVWIILGLVFYFLPATSEGAIQ
jgi:Ca2+:H+ antiporter